MMLRYYDHKEIPPAFRRTILDQSGENRIHKVPIEVCNQIIEDIENWNAESQKLQEFEVRYQYATGPEQSIYTHGVEHAHIELDRITEYGENKSVTAVLLQAGRPILGYVKGRTIHDNSSIYEGLGSSNGAERTVYMTNDVR